MIILYFCFIIVYTIWINFNKSNSHVLVICYVLFPLLRFEFCFPWKQKCITQLECYFLSLVTLLFHNWSMCLSLSFSVILWVFIVILIDEIDFTLRRIRRSPRNFRYLFTDFVYKPLQMYNFGYFLMDLLKKI